MAVSLSPSWSLSSGRRWSMARVAACGLAAFVLQATVVPPTPVSGHGRLLTPPSRSSMWRFGYKTPVNYNDNELFCGGLSRQQRNGMRCGVCGDPFDMPGPRPNEMGGKYSTGIISRRYRPGELTTVTVELTANHRGFFEFRLCPVNGSQAMETEECMQRHPIEVIGEGRHQDSSPYRYFVPRPMPGKFLIQLRMPSDVACSQCVFQWTYTAGNNWGRCENGTSAVGCGSQETFRGCADIALEPSAGVPLDMAKTKTTTTIPPPSTQPLPQNEVVPTRSPTTHAPRVPSFTMPPVVDVDIVQNEVIRPTTTPERPNTSGPRPGRVQCRGTGSYSSLPGINDWCSNNCNYVPSFCPSTHCKCA